MQETCIVDVCIYMYIPVASCSNGILLCTVCTCTHSAPGEGSTCVQVGAEAGSDGGGGGREGRRGRDLPAGLRGLG